MLKADLLKGDLSICFNLIFSRAKQVEFTKKAKIKVRKNYLILSLGEIPNVNILFLHIT